MSKNKYYRVLTENMRSLGLRKNPNIIQYSLNRKIELKSEDIVPGKDDFGGIWVCSKLSNAKTLKKYMLRKHGVNARIFEAQIGNILYENSYRTKTDSIILTKEIVVC